MTFEATAMGSKTFAVALLLIAYLIESLVDGLHFRVTLWSFERSVARVMTLGKAEAPAFLASAAERIGHDAAENESATCVPYAQLIGAYPSAIQGERVSKERNGLLWALAERELGLFTRRHSTGGTEYAVSWTLYDERQLGSSRAQCALLTAEKPPLRPLVPWSEMTLPPDAPAPRLCLAQKASPDEEYGCELLVRPDGIRYIGPVPQGSPAYCAGLRMGDRVFAVNGSSIVGVSDREFDERLKLDPLRCELLVVDEAGSEWYKERNIPVSLTMPNIIRPVNVFELLGLMDLVDRPAGSALPKSHEFVHQMAEYLKNLHAYECVITIFHAKAARKSYENEKRFFCPPPCIYLTGGGWGAKKLTVRSLYQSARKKQLARNSTYSNTLNEENIAEAQSNELRGFFSIDSETASRQHLDCSNNKDYIAVEAFFIPNKEERKDFRLVLELFYRCGLWIGTFESAKMQVNSKPSMQSFIANGTMVTLYRKPYAKPKRFLYEEGDQLYVSGTKWSAFRVHLCNENDDSEFVHYGNVIKLVDSVSGIALPKMRIRKVDNKCVILDGPGAEEPVSQTYKCAFQMVDNETVYLYLSHDKIIHHQASMVAGDPSKHRISDGAAWTIVSTDKTEFRFYEGLGPVRDSLAPVPIVLSYSTSKTDIGDTFLEISGTNFVHGMTIWLHTVPLLSTLKSNELICGLLPTETKMMQDCPDLRPDAGDNFGDVPIRISIVRNDGVIYGSSSTFFYKS